MSHTPQSASLTRSIVRVGDRMRGLLACVLLAPVGLTGCVAGPSPTQASESASPAGDPTPRWTDPPNRLGEITRSLVGTNSTNFIAQVDGPLRAGELAVEASCTGPSGSSMAYRLEASGGTDFGPSRRIECNQEPPVDTFPSEGVPRGEFVQVLIRPGIGVTKGYAILLHPQTQAIEP